MIALSVNWDRTSLRRLRRVAPFFLLVGVLTNFRFIVPSHRVEGVSGMEDAHRLAMIVGKDDLVVGDWDRVSVLYGELWADRYIDFMDEAAQGGASAVDGLRQSVANTERRGGHVYFLGLLDLSKDTWDGFLGSRCGIHFAELDAYRSYSGIVTTVSRRLDPGGSPASGYADQRSANGIQMTPEFYVERFLFF
jgi:hypothetical protein